jgi:hypothetical protein
MASTASTLPATRPPAQRRRREEPQDAGAAVEARGDGLRGEGRGQHRQCDDARCDDADAVARVEPDDAGAVRSAPNARRGIARVSMSCSPLRSTAQTSKPAWASTSRHRGAAARPGRGRTAGRGGAHRRLRPVRSRNASERAVYGSQVDADADVHRPARDGVQQGWLAGRADLEHAGSERGDRRATHPDERGGQTPRRRRAGCRAG